MTEKNYEKETLALRQVEKIHDDIYSIADILDSKAFSLLSNSGLILTLFSILQIVLIRDKQPLCYKIGLGIAVVLFIGLVAIVLHIVKPRDYKLVFKATWKGVENAVLDLDIEDAYYQLIGNYFARIENNKSINAQKEYWLRWATILFVAIILVLVGLSLVISR